VTRRTATITVVGAGIVGLATALQFLRRQPGASLVVLEKEREVGMHQSTHNSGVLHSGLYYEPGSLKARLARQGLTEMVAFCNDHAIAYEQCGKLVVATNDAETARLRVLHDRGMRNGLRDLRWLTSPEMRAIEPACGGVAALHVPEEGIVDFAAVCMAMRRSVESLGGEVRTQSDVRALRRTSVGWEIDTTNASFQTSALITCAGLHSDRVARLAGADVHTKIIPFRGEYWTLRPDRAHLVRHLLYPVPDPAFPFLGVHLTRTVHGVVEAGPNAVLALAREGYRWSTLNVRDFAEAISYPGLWRFLRRYPRLAAYEIARSFSRSLFVRSLQKLVPALAADDLVRGPAGVRAQCMDRSGALIHDFRIIAKDRAVHVLNAPSPAATASLAIGAEVVRILEGALAQ
jgi:L-2-hydroxyglutarate oxidase